MFYIVLNKSYCVAEYSKFKNCSLILWFMLSWIIAAQNNQIFRHVFRTKIASNSKKVKKIRIFWKSYHSQCTCTSLWSCSNIRGCHGHVCMCAVSLVKNRQLQYNVNWQQSVLLLLLLLLLLLYIGLVVHKRIIDLLLCWVDSVCVDACLFTFIQSTPFSFQSNTHAKLLSKNTTTSIHLLLFL